MLFVLVSEERQIHWKTLFLARFWRKKNLKIVSGSEINRNLPSALQEVIFDQFLHFSRFRQKTAEFSSNARTVFRNLIFPVACPGNMGNFQNIYFQQHLWTNTLECLSWSCTLRDIIKTNAVFKGENFLLCFL